MHAISVGMIALSSASGGDSLPPLQNNQPPRSFEELWAGYDPRKEPLEVEVLKEWEKDGVVIRAVRFCVGEFKGKKSMLAAVYGFPKGAKNLPGLVQIHGGGQSAHENTVLTNAKRGYATISLAWAGRIAAIPYFVTNDGVKLFNEGKTSDPQYRITTDWAAIDAYHDPRNAETSFGSTKPGPWTLDPVESPRNSPWFFYTLAGRRALTFLEQQPEVDPNKLGVYGHSMGGQQTVAVAATDPRVKAAAPSCGGISYRIPQNPAAEAVLSDATNLPHISCPIVFLMPANDFHGLIEDLEPAIKKLRSPDWRIVSSPHHNHQDTAPFEVATQLCFDQYLKGVFQFPATPSCEVQWKTPDGIPVATARLDPERVPLRVDFYYTQNAIPKAQAGQPKDRPAHYWRHASAVKKGDVWVAKLPLFDSDRPVWAFVNATYPLKSPVSGTGYYYRDYTADSFVVSSLLSTAEVEDLKVAGVKPALSPTPVIETFEGDWENTWFAYVPTHWARSTHKVNDPQWRAPEGAKLGIEVQTSAPLNFEMTLGEYKAPHAILAAPAWQEVVFTPSNFKNKKGEALADFRSIKVLGLGEGAASPVPGAAPKFRNLRWIPSASGAPTSSTP